MVVDSKCVLHWIVLDGPLDSVLMEVLVSLISGQGLFLSNGDILHLPGEDGCRLFHVYEYIFLWHCLE